MRTVKYEVFLVLLAKEEASLQDMIKRQIEIGRSCGMEMNADKVKVIRISKQPSLYIL